MDLYKLTLSTTAGNAYAIASKFLCGSSDFQEVVLARGTRFFLMRPDDYGRFQAIFTGNTSGSSYHSLARVTRSKKDLAVFGMNSGDFCIYEFSSTTGKILLSRKLEGPVDFLAATPDGKTFMAASLEGSTKCICHVGDEVGFSIFEIDLDRVTYSLAALGREDDHDTTIFAAIVDRAATDDRKVLACYRIPSQGVNVSYEKSTYPIDEEANLLFPVPGNSGGVLIFAKNSIMYKNLSSICNNAAMDDVEAVIPQRGDHPGEHGIHVISAAVYCQGSFLLQTEFGDIFKATLALVYNNSNVGMEIRYIDTIPDTYTMCIFNNRFLFAPGNVDNINDTYLLLSSDVQGDDLESSSVFLPRPDLVNLIKIDHSSSNDSLVDLRVKNRDKGPSEIFVVRGRGPLASLKTLRPGKGISRTQIVMTPSIVPNRVWSVKSNVNAKFDTHVVVSHEKLNSTGVFVIGEWEIQNNDGFIVTETSIAVFSHGIGSVVQVHRSGIRHIVMDGRTPTDFPAENNVKEVGHNRSQVVVALQGGMLKYYKNSTERDMLKLISTHVIGMEVGCLSVPPLFEGQQESLFFAAGSCDSSNNNIIRILLFADWSVLSSIQPVPSSPRSLQFFFTASAIRPYNLFLNAGLQDGSLLRIFVQPTGSDYSVLTSRSLGSRTPKLFSIMIGRKQAILCLSSKVWLVYVNHGSFPTDPLCCEALEYVSSYSSEKCPEGVIAVTEDGVDFFTIDSLEENFNEKSTLALLESAPIKIDLQSSQKLLVTIESATDGAFRGSSVRVLEPGSLKTNVQLKMQHQESVVSVSFMDGSLLAIGMEKYLEVSTERFASAANLICIFRLSEEGNLFEFVCSTLVKGIPRALSHFQGRLLAGVGQHHPA